MFESDRVDGPLRLLILPPTPRDGEITTHLLEDEGIKCQVCADPSSLCDKIETGAGALLIAEEHILNEQSARLLAMLREQPAWSDLPVLILTLPEGVNAESINEWQRTANVTLIQRPLKIAEFLSVVQSRLRDRQRQYYVRRLVDTLAQRSREFQQLANAMPQMVFVADQNGSIEFLNQRACQYLGYESTESPAFSPCSVIHPDDRARAETCWSQSTEMQLPFQCEFRMLKAENRKYRWHLARAEPAHDDNGDIRAWYITCTDIHQRKLAEQKLSVALDKSTAASVAKSEFLANMSHEIRTPMTAILGYAELLLEQETDSEKRRLLHVIQQNGEFLVDIINDILDLSKIEAGKLEISVDEFEIRPFVEAIGTLFCERALEKEIQFEVQVSDAIHDCIRTDAKRLRQILVNLIGNAIKFTDEGYVKLEVTRAGNDIQFVVTDSGVGMDSDLVEKLFQPFQQGDASISRRFGGTGLGLAISHRLAKMLGGEIEVRSEPRQGSQFTLSLKAVEAKSLREPVRTQYGRDRSRSSEAPELDCRVLVVDDRRDVRFLTTSFLAAAGAKVVDAANGLEAVELVQAMLAQRQCPDVILMDMQMPTMDGYEAAARLRSLGFQNPIIALTADAMQGDMTRCIESGCNSYLSKPINRMELLRMVAGHVDR